MTAVPPGQIRSVALVGHGHDGKTTLGEALLHRAGATARVGSTDAGSSLFDSEPEEQHRAMSITTALARCDWGGVRINILDTPGYQDFAGEVAQALAAADGVVLVVGSGGEVPVGAELAWEMARDRGLPTLIVVNKMDKENASYEQVVDALREAFDRKPIAVAIPLGSAAEFRGYVDLVNDRAFDFTPEGGIEEVGIPEAMREEVERAHTALVDAAAETDDILLAKYLDGTALTDEEVRDALHAAALRGTVAPVVCCSAAAERGSALVLDCIARYLPSPVEQVHRGSDASGRDLEIACDPTGPLCAMVFKTTVDSFGKVSYFKVLRGTMRTDSHPFDVRTGREERFAQLGRMMGKTISSATEVGAGDIGVVTKLAHATSGDALCTRESPVTLPPISMPAPAYSAAISATTKGDEDKIMSALTRYAEEDGAFTVDRDPVTHEMLAHGLGDIHLAVALERIKRKYGVDAQLNPPRIAYLETITGHARSQHRYKKQSGGAGLFGDCTIEIEPLPRGGGYEWQDRIVGGAVPQQFRGSVEKGVRQAIEQGVVSGHPIVDVCVRLVDGSTHPVDGKDIAFQIAGSMAMRKAVEQAAPILLEPIMNVVVLTPERLMGDVIALLNGRRGKVAGMNPLGDGRVEVSAHVPQAEMHSFPIDLRALTQGRGRYSMSPETYAEVPFEVARALIGAHTKEHVGSAV